MGAVGGGFGGDDLCLVFDVRVDGEWDGGDGGKRRGRMGGIGGGEVGGGGCEAEDCFAEIEWSG